MNQQPTQKSNAINLKSRIVQGSISSRLQQEALTQESTFSSTIDDDLKTLNQKIVILFAYLSRAFRYQASRLPRFSHRS